MEEGYFRQVTLAIDLLGEMEVIEKMSLKHFGSPTPPWLHNTLNAPYNYFKYKEIFDILLNYMYYLTVDVVLYNLYIILL